jgi:hypothetical protein
MGFFLRQRRRTRKAMRAIETLAIESAWSRPSIPAAITADRHEPGSAAQTTRGSATLDRL